MSEFELTRWPPIGQGKKFLGDIAQCGRDLLYFPGTWASDEGLDEEDIRAILVEMEKLKGAQS